MINVLILRLFGVSGIWSFHVTVLRESVTGVIIYDFQIILKNFDEHLLLKLCMMWLHTCIMDLKLF